MMNQVDKLIQSFDQALRTLAADAVSTARESPAAPVEEPELAASHRRHAAGLMRINHTGEVCAQALYQGQSLTARLAEVRDGMERAAREETDHLGWCGERLRQLDSRPSYLNPLWYAMSFGLGALAGLAGDKWSLGFVAETESQVCDHLRDHLGRLPSGDEKSRAILEVMMADEARHAEDARAAGAAELPPPVKAAMRAMAGVMKLTAYRV